MGIAQLVERCLAKAKVAGSNPVSHSKKNLNSINFLQIQHFLRYLLYCKRKISSSRGNIVQFDKDKVIMKSVIAQGATISKAIEDALNKAGKPQEFFVKVLEEGQAGFLGFGSKKAKIALFFKKDDYSRRDSDVLPQGAYKDLFNNESLDKQLGVSKQGHKPDAKPKQGFKPRPQENKKFQRRQLGTDSAKSKQRSLKDGHTKPESSEIKDVKKTGYTARRKPMSQQSKQDDNKQERRDDQQKTGDRPLRRRRSGSSSWGTNRNNAKKTDKSKDSK